MSAWSGVRLLSVNAGVAASSTVETNPDTASGSARPAGVDTNSTSAIRRFADAQLAVDDPPPQLVRGRTGQGPRRRPAGGNIGVVGALLAVPDQTGQLDRARNPRCRSNLRRSVARTC